MFAGSVAWLAIVVGQAQAQTADVRAGCVGPLSEGPSTIGDAISGCITVEPAAPAGPLVTGQTACWDIDGKSLPCAGTGQDADVQTGVPFRYTSHDNGTITDHSTGLVWEKKTPANQFDLYTWDEAFQYAASLNRVRFGGYDDWRVPNIRELASLIDFGRFDPAVSPEFRDCEHGSCIVSSSYWSSSSTASAPFLAWRINFYDGAHLVGGKSFNIRVRAVRGGL
jgi:hypothetical protein